MARFLHNSDPKGRIVIPSRLRERLGRELYVTLSLDAGYLAIYTAEAFARLKSELDALPGTNPSVRRLRRVIIGEALCCQMDGQGRVAISEELWSSISVASGDAVYLTDMGDTVLLCSKTFYDAQSQDRLDLADMDLGAWDVSGIA